jgi:hypothetical protein
MFKKAVTKNIYALATMTVFAVQPRVNVPGLLALPEPALTLTVRILRKARRKFHYLKPSRSGAALNPALVMPQIGSQTLSCFCHHST